MQSVFRRLQDSIQLVLNKVLQAAIKSLKRDKEGIERETICDCTAVVRSSISAGQHRRIHRRQPDTR